MSSAETAFPRPGFAPLAAGERRQWLDALRGFALLGILVYNIMGFGGQLFGSLVPPAPRAFASFDPAFDFLVHAFVEGKFYSLFSFLFGLGFAMQLARAERSGADALPMLRRRIGWLFVFGIAHAFLLWFGDILNTYAVLAFALLCFRRASQRVLLACALGLLASPVFVYLVYLVARMGDPQSEPSTVALFRQLVHAVGEGSYADVVDAQVAFLPVGWIRRAARLTLPRILGMFLLGVWAARAGVPALLATHRTMLRRWLVWGFAIGLPLNFAYAALGSSDAFLPASAAGFVAIVLASVGIPALCLAYVASFAFAWRDRQESLFVAAGRVPLSHYAGQSVVCTTLFYGYGFGLFGHTSYAVAIAIAVAVYLALAMLARAWLRWRTQGPLEALWRRLSYG